ncbi:hypothetical protein ACFFMN_35425 [Planobispora siamensis]|nr:hypothetical protein [Planobispora siamensis]
MDHVRILAEAMGATPGQLALAARLGGAGDRCGEAHMNLVER